MQDVGQSILESYSRVMESLAFNIMARIDDVLYVDDTIKQCAAADSILFSRGGFSGLPIQKRMSPSPFSIQRTPYASPFATPTFCSSSPLSGSPCSPRRTHTVKRNAKGKDSKTEKLPSSDFEKVWSYTGSLSVRRVSGEAPERN